MHMHYMTVLYQKTLQQSWMVLSLNPTNKRPDGSFVLKIATYICLRVNSLPRINTMNIAVLFAVL